MAKKLLNVQPFQEKLFMSYCGPASLKMVFAYYGIEKAENELAKMAGWDKNLGIDDKGIEKTAKKMDFKVKIKNYSSFEDIKSWLDKGVPVIVDWFTRGRADYSDSETADGHYSVAVGLDDKFIYLQDPEIGKIRKIKRYDFMRVWFDFKGDYIKKNELIIRQIIAIYK